MGCGVRDQRGIELRAIDHIIPVAGQIATGPSSQPFTAGANAVRRSGKTPLAQKSQSALRYPLEGRIAGHSDQRYLVSETAQTTAGRHGRRSAPQYGDFRTPTAHHKPLAS
jgi:hypothetical protein